MDAATPLRALAPAPDEAPFSLARAEGPPPTPLVFASPHSGRYYPADMMAATALDADAIRASEDAFVDELIAGGRAAGAAVITMRCARAYVDVNRDPSELDPAMFEGEPPAPVPPRTARVAAGLGAIARVVSEGREIYARKLTYDDARRRIEGVHAPYHAALAGLLDEARAAHGVAILLDWHSMPAAAVNGAGRGCDMVLGDRFGAACSRHVTNLVERELGSLGYGVVRNTPYAGGYTTEHYGRPARGVHALQVEINRGLYLDEAALRPTERFEALRGDLEQVFARLADGWRGLV